MKRNKLKKLGDASRQGILIENDVKRLIYASNCPHSAPGGLFEDVRQLALRLHIFSVKNKKRR